ncbi:MAG: transcription antitermination factor NusB [bacterium]
MGKRRLAREYALQALYLADVADMSPTDVYFVLDMAGCPVEAGSAAFAKSLVNKTFSGIKKFDALIQSCAHNWQVSRMASVDRCIMRMAACEFMSTPETPAGVIIDEAIELSKKFSTADSGRFINGVLDRLKEEQSRIHATGGGTEDKQT